MMKFAQRILVYIAVLVFIAAIIYGGTLGDFEETETVGSVMCLSCMGIE
jgi:hypothetical protein